MAIKSTEELRQDFVNELQAQDTNGKLTDTNEGSIIDILAGVVAAAVSEADQITIKEFRKTFFDTANGPDITGGPDDLQTLAVDHFGPEFARPGAVNASGEVTFSRANTDAGNVTIPAGTIVKTAQNASGASVRFETVSEVTMTGTSVGVAVQALVAGPEGNVNSGEIIQIESTLTDSTVVVTNASAMTGGRNSETDAEYRETIRRLVTRIRGASREAIEAAAEAVPGVARATAIEIEKVVIEYDISTGDILDGAEYFRIPFTHLYIADSDGVASSVLINQVIEALKDVRAYGAFIKVLSAQALQMNWTANITLNIGGPNYAEFSADPQPIVDAMVAYLNALDIGTDFIVADAEAHIMSLFGPAGTNDLSGFSTTLPVGDVSTAANEKIIAGTVGIE